MVNSTIYELIDRARSLLTYSDIPSERTDAALFLAAVAVLDEQRPDWRDSIELYWPNSSGHQPFRDIAASLRATVINFSDRKEKNASRTSTGRPRSSNPRADVSEDTGRND